MKYIIFFLGCLLVSSCCKEDLPFEDSKNNIVGTWNVKHTVQEIRADTLFSESTVNFEIYFLDNGTGSRTNLIGNDTDFDWYFQYSPQKVIIVYHQDIFASSDARSFNVLTNKQDKQIWTYDIIDDSLPADVYINTWSMTRK